MNSENKGAQLLLAASARALRQRGHDVVVSARDVKRTTRVAFGVGGYLNVERLRAARSAGLDLLPRNVAQRLPVSGDGSFDFVLDASGYSLTDSWGMAPINSRLSRLERWSKAGIGFAMLPQAFGPFARPDTAAGATRVFSFASAIWARDDESLRHASAVAQSTQRLQIAPDITIGYHCQSVATAQGQTILVPNWNIAQRGGDSTARQYVQSMVQIVHGLRQRGHDVVGLTHEGERDHALITEIADLVGDMTVLQPASGIECKAIIAGAHMVVSGRYHALVSALSTGVPVVAHSWSHKYAALLSDFGVEHGLADPFAAQQTLECVDACDRAAESARLNAAVAQIQARVDQVWDDVDRLMRSPAPA